MLEARSTLLMFAFMLLTNVARSAAQEEGASPEALFSRARLQEEIWTEGTPPMMMRAEIQVADAKGALVHGDYAFDWVSPSRWREQIRLPNYELLRVRDAKGYWLKSGLDYQPELIYQLFALLHLKDVLRVLSKQTLGTVIGREKDGVRQKCTEVKWAKGTDRVMCFEDANGALVSVEYPRGENQIPPEISRIEYGAFNAVGGKLVPYEIRALKDRKVIASVKVLEIAKITEENPALFNAPANAEFWAQCDDIRVAQLIDGVQPRYPTSARAKGAQGRVILYAVIEADGSLSHLTIIRGAGPDLDGAAVEAIRHWRYKPAQCGQTPIRVETTIATDFWLPH